VIKKARKLRSWQSKRSQINASMSDANWSGTSKKTKKDTKIFLWDTKLVKRNAVTDT